MNINVEIWQWVLVVVSSIVLIWISPLAKTAESFFKGNHSNKQPGFLILTSSLVISWLFAKSITNAANLGLQFGFVGGVAYATYYLSFVVAGLVIYKMRIEGGFKSIHHFLESRFGRHALLIFSVLIAFRLFNEIWSNTMVIGSYFGEMGSLPYYVSILVFTCLTLLYSLKGGMSSSLLTDMIQMIFFTILLAVLLMVILPKSNWEVSSYVQSGSWEMSMGLNLLFVALIQCFSYPFHDPVMTDRGFITDARTTLRSFMWAGLIGGICILLFSFVGIFARQKGLEGQAAVEVGKILGSAIMLLINFIMITSAASTLDSSFSSFAKLSNLDLKIGDGSVSAGRMAMLILAVLGTIPIFLGAEILSATTVSGTMVLGLAPVFIFWKYRTSTWSFYLPVLAGLMLGIIFALGLYPSSLHFTTGKYADLLSVNLYGSILCFLLFFIGSFISNKPTKV